MTIERGLTTGVKRKEIDLCESVLDRVERSTEGGPEGLRREQRNPGKRLVIDLTLKVQDLVQCNETVVLDGHRGEVRTTF